MTLPHEDGRWKLERGTTWYSVRSSSSTVSGSHVRKSCPKSSSAAISKEVPKACSDRSSSFLVMLRFIAFLFGGNRLNLFSDVVFNIKPIAGCRARQSTANQTKAATDGTADYGPFFKAPAMFFSWRTVRQAVFQGYPRQRKPGTPAATAPMPAPAAVDAPAGMSGCFVGF